MSNLVLDLLARLQRWIGAHLRRQVVWLSTDRRNLLGEMSNQRALVAIVGVEHYEETYSSYPIESYMDLSRVLSIEHRGQPVLSLISKAIDGRREVRCFRLRDADMLSRINAVCCVPETALVSLGLASNSLALVQRAGQQYFVSSSGLCQKAGGLVDSLARFKLAAGIPASSADVVLDDTTISSRLGAGLLKLGWSSWLRFLNPVIGRRFAESAPSAMKTIGVTLSIYLMLSSAYLLGMKTWRQAQLNELGPDVEMLLQSQRRIDLLSRESEAMVRFLDERRPTWPLWQVVAAAWGNSGEILTIGLADNKAVLRMQAQDATVVLANVASMPGVASAKFDSSVVISPVGTQSFNIGFSFDGRQAIK